MNEIKPIVWIFYGIFLLPFLIEEYRNSMFSIPRSLKCLIQNKIFQMKGFILLLVTRADYRLYFFTTLNMGRGGKSYLLFHLLKKHLLTQGIRESHIIELAPDGIANEELRNPLACYQFIKNKIMDDGSLGATR